MNVSRKMSWIVILSSLSVLLPALILFYHVAKKELLDKELSQHQYYLQVVTDEFASDFGSFSSNLEKLDQLINRQLAYADEKDSALFDERMAVAEDGAWRNKKQSYDGSIEAGLFLPPDYQVTDETKRFYGKMFDIFEAFGASSNSEKTYTNVWFLDHQRSELIFDLGYPDFIYLMSPDTDYTSTDWMTLASPERNPSRETKWTPPLFDEVSRTWMVSTVHPLDIAGKWVGTLGQDVQLRLLFDFIDSISDKYSGEQHLLRDTQGGFILAGPWQQQLETQTEQFTIDPKETELLALLSQKLSNSAQLMGEVHVDGSSYQAVAVNIQPMNWAYINLIPTRAIVAPLVKMVYLAALFLVATVLVTTLLIHSVIGKTISKPIERLALRTRLFATGQKPQPISDWGCHEVNVLAQALDLMNEDLDRETNRLAYMATHDDLTRLPNRTLLEDRLEQVIAHTKRHNTRAAVLFLDLDQFKTINDSLGHSLGDKLLQLVADRISFQLREEDTVARFGGDEFVVIVSDFEHMQDVSNIAEKLLFVINQPYIIDGYDLSITSSIGISICPDDSNVAETLIQNADTAMYQSKKQGRNDYQFYTQDIHEIVLRKLQLEDALRKAVEEKQFVLYYQPKINLKSKKICGMEALIRWQHPDLGIVSPLEFIPLAEETGMIIEIGDWVTEEACLRMKTWSEQYPWLCTMAINLSARQFRQKDFTDQIGRVLIKTKVNSKIIDFEITESMIMDDVEAAITQLAELRGLGVSISIDDFGTGYSSLSYLKHLPADRLKIDKTFVKELVNDRDDQAITKSILALAQNLHLRVVAEGVEDAEQEQLLTEMGCDFAQGFYFSPPVPAAEMTALLAEQHALSGDEEPA